MRCKDNLILASDMSKRIKARFLYTGETMIPNGIVEIDDLGTVISVEEESDNFDVFLKGLVSPGWVNSHCHLELSWLKNRITRHTGLTGFILELQKERKTIPSDFQEMIKVADAEMYQSGITAVGDISNGTDSIESKKESRIFYHNFIELFGFDPESSEKAYLSGVKTAEAFKAQLPSAENQISLTPHSAYSMSQRLLNKITELAYKQDWPLSIHNQESDSENEFFTSGKGLMFELFKQFQLPVNKFMATGVSSVKSVMVGIPNCNRIQLVHNTFTSIEDVKWVEKYAGQVYWCLCPKANLYIENTLPDIPMLMNEGCKITLGTDSLASNDGLNLLDEMKMIHAAYPGISFEEMLKWVTVNGSNFLGISKQFGTLKPGTKPSLVFVNELKNEEPEFTPNSTSNILNYD